LGGELQCWPPLVTLGKSYPKPIVDFKESRDAALAGYRRSREPAAE